MCDRMKKRRGDARANREFRVQKNTKEIRVKRDRRPTICVRYDDETLLQLSQCTTCVDRSILAVVVSGSLAQVFTSDWMEGESECSEYNVCRHSRLPGEVLPAYVQVLHVSAATEGGEHTADI